eukprot:c10099_g1_i2.p1 GENE.c10099_g1_i2~~c10099_g1_i2.p1  ORF type:complete len:561 (+),score=117.85 c10099_g1_i2:52-1734(+)
MRLQGLTVSRRKIFIYLSVFFSIWFVLTIQHVVDDVLSERMGTGSDCPLNVHFPNPNGQQMQNQQQHEHQRESARSSEADSEGMTIVQDVREVPQASPSPISSTTATTTTTITLVGETHSNSSIRSQDPQDSQEAVQTLTCIAWRQTGDCDGRFGPREANLDQRCSDIIDGANSGFCECKYAGSNHTKQFAFSCTHEEFTCEDVCLEGEKHNEDRGANGCISFHMTSECDGNGNRIGTKGCFEEIGPQTSGYCLCHSGRAHIAHCGHLTFTCAFECSKLATVNRVIEKGYSRAKLHEILFVSITRNEAHSLPKTIRWIEKTGAMFSNYHVLMLEEDSSDSTPNILKDWAARNSHVIVECRREHSHSADRDGNLSNSRFQRLADLRNRYVEKISDPIYAHVSHVIVVDSDLTLGWDLDGIAHSFGLLEYSELGSKSEIRDWKYQRELMNSQWDAVCSNSIVHSENDRYYDSLAYLDLMFKSSNFGEHQEIIHTPIDPANVILSCFGGLAIYRKSVLEGCRYGLLKHVNPACEHHGLHKCLYNNGKRLLFNPRQVVNYRAEN